jgi:uncharacterized protein YndB with AHSA1/START domain
MTARFIIVRDIAAPRERVFRAWTDPDQARCWLRAAAVAFHEVVAPRRLVLSTGDGPSAPLAAVIFADRGDHTEITLAASAPEDEADALEENWTLRFDRLDASVGEAGR